MKRTIKTSDDGSHTIYNEEINETYHSHFGAITESLHIFIENGFKSSCANPINILEIGFGTGLNAFLTLLEADKSKRTTIYHSIELYPVEYETVNVLNYPEIINSKYQNCFLDMHKNEWGKSYEYSPFFSLQKIDADVVKFEPKQLYDVVYFDAFSPEKQPELWSSDLFEKMYRHTNPGGLLLTYCAKGLVKRNLRSVGYKVELLPGPPGKRHIIKAIKE